VRVEGFAVTVHAVAVRRGAGAFAAGAFRSEGGACPGGRQRALEFRYGVKDASARSIV